MKITSTLAKIMLLSVSMLLSQQGAAAPINPEGQPLGYIGPIELSNTDLTNGAKGYRGWFENAGWQGDLVEYDITSGGGISTSIDFSEPSPKQSDGGSNWSAHVTFQTLAGDGDPDDALLDPNDYWHTGRKIIFSNNYGQNQKAFRWGELTTKQRAVLDNLADPNDPDDTSDVLDYIRGARDNEGPAGSMRTRYSLLGDIIHSNPEYVGKPEGNYTDSEYVAFKNDNGLSNRAARVYVGANDGMLHAFDADTGQEKWAYVPSMLIPKLKRLVGRPFSHTYFVDGGITVQDAYVNGEWRTILVGSLGAGGRGLYALNVTNENLTSEYAASGDDKKIMWEERAENTPGDDASTGANPDIGYIFDASTIAKLNDGKWYAVFGNGIGSDNGQAKLMMKELSTNSNPTTIKISTESSTDNGLAAPALVDTNGDGKADIAWAGDINGDLWRFNLPNGPSTGTSSYKVYDGDPSQPITQAPDVARHPQYGYIVMFGTGKLYEAADLEDDSTQALYGIWDTGVQQTQPLLLQSQELSFNTDYTRFGFDETVRTYTTSVLVNYNNNYKGWKVELYPGERMLTSPQLRAGRLKTTIYNPDGGTNWLLEADFLDGNMANNSIYNLNQDNDLNEDDRVNGNENLDGDGAPDYSDPEDIPMGWQRPDGNMSQPTIASLSAGVDTMFLNFLNPPIVEVAVAPPEPTGESGCVGVCSGGLEGGHFDLDHDTDLGGSTDEHTHEYDDDTNRTYIDFLDMVEQHDIQDDVANGVDFIPLIANADFSKGGTLLISRNGSTDDVEYNVVEYQKMIHQALAEWDGVSDLTDPEGRSLIFKINQVDKFRITFNSLALITGGLHPSETGCVKDDPVTHTYNGRWRNGALVMHLVKADLFDDLGASESALDRLVVQTPVDFQEAVYLPPEYNGVRLTKDVDEDGFIVGTGPDYEIYGGLHADPARAENGFLYESTVFWHFDGDCYGKPNWSQDYYVESQNTVYEILYEALDRAEVSNLEELAAKIDGLLASGCATEGGGDSGDKDKDGDKDAEPDPEPVDPDAPVSCQEEYDSLAETYALGLLIEANGVTIQCDADGCLGDGGDGDGDGDGEGGGASISGELQTIEGGIDETGITSGPNFEVGRRTWIDILPE
jgi:hypothetical protein